MIGVGRASAVVVVGRGAVGGLSLPRMNSRISGAVTFAYEATELLLHEAARVTPTTTGVAPARTSAPPLSPLHGELEPENAQSSTPFAVS